MNDHEKIEQRAQDRAMSRAASVTSATSATSVTSFGARLEMRARLTGWVTAGLRRTRIIRLGIQRSHRLHRQASPSFAGGDTSSKPLQHHHVAQSWARATRDACRAAGVAFFMKQTGHNATYRLQGVPIPVRLGYGHEEPARWPQDLRIREWPSD